MLIHIIRDETLSKVERAMARKTKSNRQMRRLLLLLNQRKIKEKIAPSNAPITTAVAISIKGSKIESSGEPDAGDSMDLATVTANPKGDQGDSIIQGYNAKELFRSAALSPYTA